MPAAMKKRKSDTHAPASAATASSPRPALPSWARTPLRYIIDIIPNRERDSRVSIPTSPCFVDLRRGGISAVALETDGGSALQAGSGAARREAEALEAYSSATRCKMPTASWRWRLTAAQHSGGGLLTAQCGAGGLAMARR